MLHNLLWLYSFSTETGFVWKFLLLTRWSCFWFMFWWVCPTVCIVALKLATKVTARTSDLCVDWEMNFNWVTDPAICGWTARKHFCIYDTPLSNDLVSVYTVSTKKLACQLLWPHVLFSRTCAHLPISPLTSLCGLCTESPVGQNSKVGWFMLWKD